MGPTPHFSFFHVSYLPDSLPLSLCPSLSPCLSSGNTIIPHLSSLISQLSLSLLFGKHTRCTTTHCSQLQRPTPHLPFFPMPFSPNLQDYLNLSPLSLFSSSLRATPTTIVAICHLRWAQLNHPLAAGLTKTQQQPWCSLSSHLSLFHSANTKAPLPPPNLLNFGEFFTIQAKVSLGNTLNLTHSSSWFDFEHACVF